MHQRRFCLIDQRDMRQHRGWLSPCGILGKLRRPAARINADFPADDREVVVAPAAAGRAAHSSMAVFVVDRAVLDA